MDYVMTPFLGGYIGSARPYLDGTHEMTLILFEKFPYADGSGYCYRFKNDTGACIVWFSKRKIFMSIPTCIRAQFVINRHVEYAGVKENVVKSLKILEHLQ